MMDLRTHSDARSYDVLHGSRFGDSTELYAEERQAEVDEKADVMRKRQEAVPGLLNPHVRHDDMSDM